LRLAIVVVVVCHMSHRPRVVNPYPERCGSCARRKLVFLPSLLPVPDLDKLSTRNITLEGIAENVG
jgi:hypothetical protein